MKPISWIIIAGSWLLDGEHDLETKISIALIMAVIFWEWDTECKNLRAIGALCRLSWSNLLSILLTWIR